MLGGKKFAVTVCESRTLCLDIGIIVSPAQELSSMGTVAHHC